MARNQTNGTPEVQPVGDLPEVDEDTEARLAEEAVQDSESNPTVEVEVDGEVIDTRKLFDYPVSTIFTYFMRGFKHAYQNEPASSAGKTVEKSLNLPENATKAQKADALSKYRDEHKAEWHTLLVSEAMKRVTPAIEGNVSLGLRGDPEETEFWALVDKGVKARIKNEKDAAGEKIKYPTNDETVITFANGATRTRKQMRDNFVAGPSGQDGLTNGDVLRAQAKEIVAARRIAPPVPVPAGVNDPDALGI